jgi:hypothetical protein
MESEMNLNQEAEARRQFIALIKEKRTEHFEKDSTDEERILDHVLAADEKLWKQIQPILARDAALDIVRRVVKGTPIAYDGPQPKLFDDLPPRIATQDGGWKPMNRASLKELRWFTNWYELRLQGTLKRTERDTEILMKLQRLTNVVERYAGKDDEIIVEAALAVRDRRAAR